MQRSYCKTSYSKKNLLCVGILHFGMSQTLLKEQGRIGSSKVQLITELDVVVLVVAVIVSGQHRCVHER